MKVVIGGSFSVYDEMEKLALELRKVGIKCFLPKHFSGQRTSASIKKIKGGVQNGKKKLSQAEIRKIGEVEKLFFNNIKKADYLIILNEAIKERGKSEGYIGINSSTDIGCAIGSGIPVILTHQPRDIGLSGLCSVGLVKVINTNKILEYLKKK